MQLSDACTSILHQLAGVVRQIEQKDFVRPSRALSQSTVGQHIRHTIEFFICLENGFHESVVNYDKRPHDKQIETNKLIALRAIENVRLFVENQRMDRPMKLEVGYEPDSEMCMTISTNYFRELTYNIEHAVHHMAIMKIGLREVAPYVSFPPDFGVAMSTIRYKETIAAH